MFLTTATNEDRNARLFVDFYEFAGAPAKISRALITWSGVPGNPEFSWAKDSAGLYLHLETAVVYIAPGDQTARPAESFPVCFIPTNSGRAVSDAGLFFSRNQEGAIELQRQAEFLSFKDAVMTRDVQAIGRGCP